MILSSVSMTIKVLLEMADFMNFWSIFGWYCRIVKVLDVCHVKCDGTFYTPVPCFGEKTMKGEFVITTFN